MLRIIRANCRRLFWIHLVGVSWTAFLLAVIAADLREAHPGSLPGSLRMTKLFFWLLFTAQLPAVYGSMGLLYRGPQDLVETLPLSMNRLNLARLLSTAVHLGLGLVSWVLVIWFWVAHEQIVQPWVGAFTLVLFMANMLVSMRFRFLRFLPPVLVALLPIPDIETVLGVLFRSMTTPWASLALLILTLSYGWWVVTQAPPIWVRRATPLGA